ncbi:MAG TPA: RNA polymerase sigma factor RpoD/SigA [Thermoanaerobaculia bacterium]|nr:RNA polymerase sigma factor RpoD/SigA [Thermoanaerobaculia bacterium]
MSQRLRPEDDSKVLRKYLDDIARYAILTPERERELGRIIQCAETNEDTRREAIDELVRGNLRFVVSYAKRFHSPGISFLDLINEGNIGLIQAARRFDPDRGVKFITYAVWWVRQAISNALSEQWGAIRLPHKQATLHSRLGRVKEALSRSLGREATMEEIATEAGLRPDEAENLMAMSRSSESLSELFGAEEDRTLGDTLEQTSVAAADDQLLQRSSVEQTRNLLESLPKKERAILCRRFGIPEDGSDGEREPMTLQEIGEELRLSRERVRQIEAQAIARIKRTMKSRALKAFLN